MSDAKASESTPAMSSAAPQKPPGEGKAESEQNQERRQDGAIAGRVTEAGRGRAPSRPSIRSRRKTVVDLLSYLVPRHASGASLQRFLGIRRRTADAGPSGMSGSGSAGGGPTSSAAADGNKTPPGPLSPDSVKVSVLEDKSPQASAKKKRASWLRKSKPPQRVDEEGLQDLLSSLPSAGSTSSNRHTSPTPHRRMPAALRDRLQAALECCIFCVLVAILGMVVFYSVAPTEAICRTDVCHSYAKLLWEMLNMSVDPCDDFYSYVCSKWDARHSYSFKEGVYLQFMEDVSKRNRRTVAPARGQSASEKAAQFYQSCSATYTQGGDRELDTVKRLLLRFGVLWPRLSNATNVLRISFSMSAALDWAPVILFSVERPMAQMTVSPSHFLPDVLTRREVMLAGGGTNYRVYFGHMLGIFGHSDEPGKDVPTYDDLLAMESRLLPVLRQALTAGKGDTLENATLDDVFQLTNNAIPRSTWDVQFREYFGTAGSHGTSSYRFTVGNVRFLVAFFDLVRELGESHVAYCLGWAAVQGLSRLTKPDIIRYYYSSHGDAARDHLLFCAVLAHRYMGLAYYASYIRDEFTPELIEDVTRLVSDVRASFREGYAPSPVWKEFVERSVQTHTENASSKGPPLSFVRDSREDVLDKLFERFPDINSTIFDNIEGAVAARRATRRDTRMARFFWNGTVRFHYLVEPTNVTAPRTFELLPVAMEPFFYNVKAPLAVKYGALGTEIADAIAGLVFGDLREADNGTRATVESQPLCFIDLSLAGSRHASPPPGWPQMTRLELAESVMSLDAAFRAFFDVTDGGHQEKLDGFDSLSGNMMMFVFWCMTKCGTSEGRYRCNDPLRLFRYFGQSFKCGVERSMSTVRDCV